MPKQKSQLNQPPIAAILPVYNEETTIGHVLAVLSQVKIIHEIIVVDDGSSDKSLEVIRENMTRDSRIRLIQHDSNQGKGQAIFDAWYTTQAPLLVLMDTDLINLSPQHVMDLITPVLNGKVDMTLGIFRNGRLDTDLAHRATPWLTGQRCLRAEILKHVSLDAAHGYGFEVALTISYRQHGYQTSFVYLNGVWHPPSEFHRGLWHGIFWRMRMYYQIIRGSVIASRKKWPTAKSFFSSLIK